MSRARCHVDVYRAVHPETQLRPWVTWCYHHEPAPNRGDSCRGILAHSPTWQDAINLALAHATYARLAARP